MLSHVHAWTDFHEVDITPYLYTVWMTRIRATIFLANTSSGTALLEIIIYIDIISWTNTRYRNSSMWTLPHTQL